MAGEPETEGVGCHGTGSIQVETILAQTFAFS